MHHRRQFFHELGNGAPLAPIRGRSVIRSLLPMWLCAACSLSPSLPERPPGLRDFDEPLELRAEPDDEATRQRLPAGCFSGLEVADARGSLAAKLDEPAALRIARIVENSPAAAAGLEVDDLLLAVRIGDGPERPLTRASEWRKVEVETPPDTELHLAIDRAGREAVTKLRLLPRVRPAERERGERFREDERVGVVLRTATEVEARAAGLGPGGGAVVVGMSANSPWRRSGIAYGDLIAAVDDRPLAHPRELLLRLRDPALQSVRLRIVRAGDRVDADVALSVRSQQLREITLPLLFSYEADRGRSEWSLLLGLLHYRSTAAAWRFRLLWLIGFGGGDADQLLEVDG
jgi:hypothetical protein